MNDSCSLLNSEIIFGPPPTLSFKVCVASAATLPKVEKALEAKFIIDLSSSSASVPEGSAFSSAFVAAPVEPNPNPLMAEENRLEAVVIPDLDSSVFGSCSDFFSSLSVSGSGFGLALVVAVDKVCLKIL